MAEDERGKVVRIVGNKQESQEFEQVDDLQMELFFLPEKKDKNYSHLTDLYDMIPRFSYGRPKRKDDIYLKTVRRQFRFKDTEYELTQAPARLSKTLKDGSVEEKDHHPGLREELIEDALFKIACEGAGGMFDDGHSQEAGVVFTLYKVQAELESRGHKYNIGAIKEGILVSAGSIMTLIDKTNGEQIFVSPMFATVGLTTREDWVKHGSSAKAFVRFNPLVSRSIRQRTFRMFNYSIAMQLRTTLGRYLHKRLSFLYRQASAIEPYTIHLNRLIRDSGMTRYAKISNNHREVEKTLEELKSKNVLTHYNVDVIFDEQRKNKIEDYKYTIYAHPNFANEMKRFNARSNEIELKATRLTIKKEGRETRAAKTSSVE